MLEHFKVTVKKYAVLILLSQPSKDQLLALRLIITRNAENFYIFWNLRIRGGCTSG